MTNVDRTRYQRLRYSRAASGSRQHGATLPKSISETPASPLWRKPAIFNVLSTRIIIKAVLLIIILPGSYNNNFAANLCLCFLLWCWLEGGTQLGGQGRQRGLSGMHHYFQISSFLLTCPKLWPIQRNNACRGDTSSIALSLFVMALPDPSFFFFLPLFWCRNAAERFVWRGWLNPSCAIQVWVPKKSGWFLSRAAWGLPKRPVSSSREM